MKTIEEHIRDRGIRFLPTMGKVYGRDRLEDSIKGITEEE